MKSKRIKFPILGAMLIIVSVTIPAWSQGHDHHPKHGDSNKSTTEKEVKHLLGNKKCPVMGGDSSAESYVEAVENDGKLVGRIYMCCDGCDKFAELYKSFYRPDQKTGKAIDPLDLKNLTCPITKGRKPRTIQSSNLDDCHGKGPDMFTMKTKTNSPTPSVGTIQLFGSASKSWSV